MNRGRHGEARARQDLVFAAHQGRPLMHRNIFRVFKRLLRDAGPSNIRFHDPWRANAPLLLGQGAHPKVVWGRLGLVVRIFPNTAASLRLVTALCVEQSDEWVSGRRYLDLGELSDGASAAPVGAGHAPPLRAVN